STFFYPACVRFRVRSRRAQGRRMLSEPHGGRPRETEASGAGTGRESGPRKVAGKGLTAGYQHRILALDRCGPHPSETTRPGPKQARSAESYPPSPTELYRSRSGVAPCDPATESPRKKG